MDYKELLRYLDLEDPAEFIYFESMADLVECDETIEQEVVQQIFEGAPMETVGGLFEEYFEDIMEGLPEDAEEIYTLLQQAKLSLMGLASAAVEEEGDIRRLTDEFMRFRQWYTEGSDVELSAYGEDEVLHQCLRDAIATARMEKLGGVQYRYDFDNALGYLPDSYSMSMAELVALEQGEDNDGQIVFDPEEDDYMHREDDLYEIDERILH